MSCQRLTSASASRVKGLANGGRFAAQHERRSKTDLSP
jgi:hypothetical protein